MQTIARFSTRYSLTAMMLTALMLGTSAVQAAETSRPLEFETHAAFFSSETKQKDALDPQVFVKAASAESGVGPQGIRHAPGLKNALTSDDINLPLYTAEAKPLGMSLGEWLAANGHAVLSPQPDGKERITVVLSGLKPGGHYSLFENHFEQHPIGFTPLDGTGIDNNFIADSNGRGTVTVISPSILTHDNAVLLVYHSDGQTHGKSRGAIGLNAHHQLIARPK
ncbi:MAG: hypothetical protein JWQ21_1164 [Herminiimonas sp.]|nr:hypothetical protein [Herminiimonas sp.]